MATPRGNTYTVASGGGIYAGIARPSTGGSAAGAIMAAIAALLGGGASGAAPAPSGTLATLSLRSTGTSGTYPYSATVMPLRGQVPAGFGLVSSDDATLRSATLAAHDDGSAALVIVSGTATVTGGASSTVTLQAGTPAGANLTAAAISALVSSVAVDFGGTYGTATVSSFGTPERIWWQTPGTICARYRVAAPTPGSTALEAVIDIHAWSGRALVEVVVENGKIDAAASTSSTKPTSADYTATVSVNGSTIATVTSASGPNGTHEAFRAWRASTWVGAGDPGLVVHQAVSELQEHPLLWRMERASTADMSVYASDAYTPWATGRHRATNMGGTGDHDSIGALPTWEARWLQTGDYRAARAVEASSLAMLTYNINHRDSVTGAVPHSAVMPLKCQGSFWANWPTTTTEPAFESAHQPASGLCAFLVRPSPVYIEVAQKIGTWAGSVHSTRDLLNNFVEATVGITDCTGIVGGTQLRSKAWGLRNITHATWLSPNDHPWRASGREWIDRNIRYWNAYGINSRGVLLPLYEGEPDAPLTVSGGLTGYKVSLWMYHWCVTEVHKLAASRILAQTSEARQAAADTVADRLATAVCKWVTEQPNGGWRYLPYRTRIGDASSNLAAYSTWTAQRAADLSGAPSSVTGQLGGGSQGNETTWAAVEATGTEAIAYGNGTTYTQDFWAALVAAMERNVPGSGDAWYIVQNGVTNLSTWAGYFANDPRRASTPRNVRTWAASVPANTWTQLSGTNYFTWATANTPAGDYLGSQPIAAAVNAYNDPASDRDSDYIFGGGHSDGTMNGVPRFDRRTLTYNFVALPTPPSKYPPGYGSGGTVTYPSGQAGDGYFCDASILTNPLDAAYITPLARVSTHMYGAAVKRGDNIHYLYGIYGNLNTRTGTWTGRGLKIGPQIAVFRSQYNASFELQQGTMAHYDQATDRVFFTLSAGDAGLSWRSGIVVWNPATETAQASIEWDFANWQITAPSVSIVAAGRKLFIFTKIAATGSERTMQQGVVIDMDLAAAATGLTSGTGTIAKRFVVTGADIGTMSGAANQETIPAWFDGKAIRRWNYKTGKVGFVYSISPTPDSGTGTTADPFVHTQTETAIAGTAPPTVTLVYKRTVFDAASNCMMVLPTANSNWYAIKLS